MTRIALDVTLERGKDLAWWTALDPGEQRLYLGHYLLRVQT